MVCRALQRVRHAIYRHPVFLGPIKGAITMKKRKILSLVLAVLMLCSVLSACAQSQPSKTPSDPTDGNENALYQVTVYGADGKPATSGVVVQFMQNGEQVAMETLDASGVASKELPKGDYTVELRFMDSKAAYYYDKSDMTLSKTKTQMTILLCLEQSTEGETVYADDMEHMAYPLSVGNTYVTLKPGRNYFLFVPGESGEYELFAEDATCAVGYYGNVHFIQSVNQGKEAPNNGTALSLSSGMVGPESEFVIGVDNPGTEDVKVVLHVVRVSDYIDTSVPNVIYEKTHAVTPWTQPMGKQLKKFDVTAVVPYNLVLNEKTGFYHLNSVAGPLVVVCLGKKADMHITQLASYQTILENSGVKAYIQNPDGTYDRCEIYSDCLLEYIACVDQNTGLYPLTEDLMYIIQQHGKHSGWWDITGERYIFGDTQVNEKNAWLFMCGYLG